MYCINFISSKSLRNTNSVHTTVQRAVGGVQRVKQKKKKDAHFPETVYISRGDKMSIESIT